ncbi:MAG: SDR family oxidoreductase [Acidobacteria bacterium]|nr:SDR family oxidoreductase [Acidobacteriota bacterium]
MATTRREFLHGSILGALWGAAGITLSPRAGFAAPQQSAGRKLLILGGTSFLGPSLVEGALSRGWSVTLFNRGKTNPELFPDVEKLRGDRDGKLDALKGRAWDAVVDTSGYVPRHVRDSATLLKDAVRQYVFISTVSVYPDNSKPVDETSPVGKLADETTEKVTGESYGPLKALCEQAAEKALPGRVTNIRPGLIVGPRDPSDRFTYWPARVDRGGEVLAPGSAADPIQVIDVRDLAEWTLRTIESNVTGVFNAVGPKGTLTMGELLAACKSASGSNATFTWVPAEFLEQQQVAPWSDMPVWLPPTGETAGFAKVSNERAAARGLTFRPIGATVKDTLAWWKSLPAERRSKLRAGIKPEREAEVLAAWHAGQAAGAAGAAAR